MCDMCNGKTRDDIHDHLADLIHRYGWAIQAVEHDRHNLGWAYTIGLIEKFAHPELVLVGLEAEVAGAVLQALCERIRAGDRLSPEVAVDLGGISVDLSAVHPEQLRYGVFNMWLERYDWLPEPPRFEALEVIVPGHFCDHHASLQPALKQPVRTLDATYPNRAQRRAHMRRRR